MTDESVQKRRLHLAAPAACLLIVLAVYVVSYVLLVNLPSIDHVFIHHDDGREVLGSEVVDRYYSHGGRFAEIAFWPLEQIDRRIRPGAWGPRWERDGHP